MRIAALLGSILMLGNLVVAAQAGPMKLGELRFEVPKGWKTSAADAGGIMLQRPFAPTADESEGIAMIQIGAPVAGPPQDLAANLAGLASVVEGLEDEEPFTEGVGTTATGYDIAVEFRCCALINDLSVSKAGVALAAHGQQVYLHLVMLNIDDKRQDAAEADFESLVRSFRFKDSDAAGTLVPKADDGGLDGAFTHLATGLMPNVFGGLDFTAESEIVLFAPGGLFSDTLPAGDGTLAEHCAANPTDCGTYRVKGGGWFTGPAEITMARVVDDYGRIETETQALTKQGENLVIGDADYTRIPPLADGTRLDGEWRYFFASSGSGAISSGSIAVEKTLHLMQDGRFARSGFAGGSSTTDTGSGTAGVTATSQDAGDRGRYEIAGFQLTLTGEDGQSETLSIFAPEPKADDLLVIDGNNYLKQD